MKTSNYLLSTSFKDCFPVENVAGGKLKAESFIVLVQVSHLLPQNLIQILVLQHRLPQNGQLQKCGIKNLDKLKVNLLFFPCKTQ